MMKTGKLFQDSRRQMDLCFFDGGAEKCFERKRHGCGGDGDEDNCQTRRYVKVERLEEAKADLIKRLPPDRPNDYTWTMRSAIAYAPFEVANWLTEWFGEIKPRNLNAENIQLEKDSAQLRADLKSLTEGM
jgi:hypothetical protein